MSYTSPGKQLSDGGPDGTILGQSATDLISFYGVTPVAQRSGATQAALTLTTVATSTGAYGFATSTAFSAFIAQLGEIVATLTALGAWKGGA